MSLVEAPRMKGSGNDGYGTLDRNLARAAGREARRHRSSRVRVRRDVGKKGGPPSGAGGLAATVALLLVVAGLYIVGGVPLQLFLGEPGLLLAQLTFLLLPPLVFVWWARLDPVWTLSLRWPSGGQLGGGILVLLGGTQLAWILAWAQSLVMPVPAEYLEAMASLLQADSLGRYLWLLVLAAVVPALAEEVLFRGVVLSGFRSALPTLWAVVGAGLVFGLFHLSPQTAFRFLPTAWLGMLLAWVVVVSGSLPLAILLHFLNNAAILTIVAIPATREQMTDIEGEPSLLLLPVGLLLLGWGLWILHANRGPRVPEEAG